MSPRFPMGVRVAIAAAALLLTLPIPTHAARRHLDPGTVTLVGAGDIAVCGSSNHDKATAAIVASILSESPNNVAFTAGDNVYPDGSSNWYASCYDPTWGAFKLRTRPVPGNHDHYHNPTFAGYFGYFGSRAGPSGRGYYNFDVGSWRIYALTSECIRGSLCYINQYKWLQTDLIDQPHHCVLAIWHRPRFSSGAGHGSSTRMAPVFDLLYQYGAEIVVSGHDHEYERFAPTDPSGNPAANGVRQWVVGTGGASLYHFASVPLAASEVRNDTNHGVLRLDLGPSGYDWQFIAEKGTFTDTGSASCH